MNPAPAKSHPFRSSWNYQTGGQKRVAELAPNNPWQRQTERGVREAVDVVTRCEIVKEATYEKCQLYLAWPGTQKTVRIAIKNRLGVLAREHRKQNDAPNQPWDAGATVHYQGGKTTTACGRRLRPQTNLSSDPKIVNCRNCTRTHLTR